MAKKVRPNPVRQLILVGLAVVGLGVGYGLGYLFKAPRPAPVAEPQPQPVAEPAVAPAPTPAAQADAAHPALPPPNTVLPEDAVVAPGPVRAYEEALPKEIVVTVERLGSPKPATGPAPAAAQDTSPPAAPPPAAPDAAAPASQPPPPASQRAEQSAADGPAPAAAWRAQAVAVTPDGRPMIAIVFDDLGIDKARTRRAVDLPGPLSMSFLTYATHLDEQTAAARAAGHEIWLHMPMEPGSRQIDPGPKALLTSLDEAALRANLRWSLDRFAGYVGINNHMGSRFTANLAGMRLVMAELKERGLAFLDSVTSGASKSRQAAAEAGVDFTTRNIFIDHEDDIAAIQRQLAQIEALARKQGHAIAIGHPREKTLAAITPWLESLDARGFQLAPVSAFLTPPNAEVAAKK